MSKDVQVPNSWKFLFGGLSGCGAAAVVQPMDLVKNRMQVHHFYFLTVIVKLFRVTIIQKFVKRFRFCKRIVNKGPLE